MKLLLNARNFTEPTLETLRDYSLSKFAKVLRVAPKKAHYQPLLQVSAEYNMPKGMFTLKVVFVINKKSFVYRISDKDLRRAIDLAESNIRQQIISLKGKRWSYQAA